MSVLGRVLHGCDGPGNARQAMRGKAWIGWVMRGPVMLSRQS